MEEIKDLKMIILLIISGITFLFAIGVNLLFQERKSYEGSIQAAIASANYCESASDCAFAGSACPFGCNIYVNETEAARIGDILSRYQSTCAYSCVPLKSVECIENRCVPLFE
ncbi:MAG: hypothetical protein COW88_00605 [Candidatus Lloydbacteria bacterium CG22_combo_CG10-13_8_21_14_all_47_15]|uniref:Uncharacterized protein n=1 Tax=Candidatus Lloydbacteria bacterium CG22_combo_CG10-13_8_21_14_all_47_15 TaxID=1974635 RepID=A0A2H0CVQ7_9BACT|nr:MAG: hypothetical protein COW88_00605 [Candidatus Lloydbacteria bacterium CG22_combo_CG10-13_8_21_14_all_47_15]